MVDLRTREGRALREHATRANDAHSTAWKEPSKLPDPEPRDGFAYRWIRTATLGQADPTNVSTRFREGWVPVPKEEAAGMGLMQDHASRFPDNLEVGGLLLCKIDKATIDRRQRHYEQLAKTQVDASDSNFMRESDPRMPVLQSQRQSRTTFGSGRPAK